MNVPRNAIPIGISAVCGVGILVLCLVGGAFGGGGNDPTDYIEDHYQRSASQDEPDGGAAYTSASSQTSVVSDLRDNTDELDHRSAGGTDFLQYGDHIVAVRDDDSLGGGSLIYVDDYRTGYQRYSSGFAGFALFGWGSSPPRGGGFVGGGGGFGK